jgi:hypothetical protein
MKWLLGLAAALEAVTGLALLIDPVVVARLLLGGDLTGMGPPLGRVAGIALLSLGLACWQWPGTASPGVFRALLTYNLLVTLYLLWLGIGGEWVGVLLWPAMALHAVLTLLLAGSWWRGLARGHLRQE